MNSRVPKGDRAKAAIKAVGFYARWYPKQWLPLEFASTTGMEPELAGQVRYVKRSSRKLARRLFHAMLLHGPKLEQRQILLGRFVAVGTELFAIAASASWAQHLIGMGKDRDEVLGLVEHFCQGSKRRVRDAFRGIGSNSDVKGYKLAQGVLGGAAPWLSDEVVGEPAWVGEVTADSDEAPAEPDR